MYQKAFSVNFTEKKGFLRLLLGSTTPLLDNLCERIKELIDTLLTTYIKSKSSLSTNDQDLLNPLLHELVASPPNKYDVSDIFSILLEKHLNVMGSYLFYFY